MKKLDADWCADPWFAGTELSRIATEIDEHEGDEIKSVVWEIEQPLRSNLPLKLRRVKTYSRTGTAKDSYSTELECLKKLMPVAPVKDRSSAKWILDKWVKLLDPILAKYEETPSVLKITTINSPDTFMQAVTQTEKYKEKYKDE